MLRFSVRMKLGACVFALGLGLGTISASAQTDSGPSQSAMTNLIHLLVKNKVITQESANALIKEAEQEAAQARAAKTATPAAPVPIPTARPEPPPPEPGVVRVPYVPQIVRNQIRDEVKAEVLKEAKAENWAQPNIFPDWVRRFNWYGDFRGRDEFDLYGKNNIGSDGVDGFINYAAFNANGPTNVNPNTILNTIPFLNTTVNRYNLASLRARFGFIANVADGVEVGVRLGTGNDSSPVSTTQLLGGGLDKKDIWLDQGFIQLTPFSDDVITFGRMPDPFFHTDLVYDENLNFDGLTLAATGGELPWVDNTSTFATLGIFPVGYINTNFPTNSPVKAGDRTEFLVGAQLGTDWREHNHDWKFGVALYRYFNAQGALSAPCPIYLGAQQCSTDDTVPPFMQKGNTLFLIRSIIPDPQFPTTYAQPQFAGLMFNYDELDATTSFDLKIPRNYDLIFTADYVRNIGFDGGDAYRYAAFGVYPVTNFNPITRTLESGPNAFNGSVQFGDAEIHHRWEWNIIGGYKYIQPDAVLDAFNDHDFHMGGTNAKGYYLKASLGIFDNTWLSARWFSADEVYGPPLAIDVMQLDLNARF
ncbi:MAG TPA: putative porin [Rhizomicrobium sp.]|nr:putative porin [Rhizomicrobium sp.]